MQLHHSVGRKVSEDETMIYGQLFSFSQFKQHFQQFVVIALESP